MLNKTELRYIKKYMENKKSDYERGIEYSKQLIDNPSYPYYTETSFKQLSSKHQKNIDMCQKIISKIDDLLN